MLWGSNMKRLISLLTAVILIIGCLPAASFAAEENKKYDKNTENVYFSEKYAQIGVPISVKTSADDTEHIYKWYINGKEITNAGNSYTPVKADLECMLTAEVYNAHAEKIGAANMFISKLPVIYIETENRKPIIEKKRVLKAQMKLQGNSDFNDDSVLYDGEIEIKGRGNSTWDAEKKPYKLKLESKSDLLGMGKNKHWVLLSNPYDRSLSRNKLTYDLASDMGLDSAKSQWVDVVLNGEVVGNYLLCEHVRIGSTRVNITDWDEIAEDTAKAIYKANKKSMSKDERDELAELMEADMNWVTEEKIEYKGKTYKISDYYNLPSYNGGYLLECFGTEQPCFTSEGGNSVCISKPEGIGKGMLEEIQGYYSAFERAAKSKDFCTVYKGKRVRYSDLADVESFAKGILLNEIFQNQDFLHRSTYMYKDVDGKLIFGPVWDFDMTSDNSSYVYSHNSWICFSRGYFANMVKDPVFLKAVYDAYREYRYTAIADLLKPDGDFDKAIETIRESAINDDMLWKKTIGFETDIENFRLWLTRRLSWIDSQMTSFETFYASVNGTAPNNSGYTTLNLNGSQLDIAMADGVATSKVFVNGIEKQNLTYKDRTVINLDSLGKDCVISVMSYDSNGDFLGMSTISGYKEPVSLKMSKAPTKSVYNSGDAINLDGLELRAVYADKSEQVVQPESALSYVDDCLGSQEPVYGRITDRIGNTYISLKYLGLNLDFKVTKNPNEDYEKVAKLIDRLPKSNYEDNLDTIFNAKQEYDALSDTAKAKVSNASLLNAVMSKLDEISENSTTPILGCYIDRLGRMPQKNKVVVVAKGKPNKIRFFFDGNTTTIPVANRNYCISEKYIAGYSVMTIVYSIVGENIDVGAYYNHIQKGELYHFNATEAIENRSQMISSVVYDKSLSSFNDLAELYFTVNKRVEKISAECDGEKFTTVPKNGTATVEMCFSDIGYHNVDIGYYADGEWHYFKTITIYVRDERELATQFALDYPSATAYDSTEIYVATSKYTASVRLVSDKETLNLTPIQKNGFKVWSGKIDMTEDKSYQVSVDYKNIGRTVKIQKLDKLLIKDGVLIECRIKSGNIDIPYSVTSVADGAFNGFNGTIRCYKNSAAQQYAVTHKINYILYGYSIEIPSELSLDVGKNFSVSPTANPLVPPDFGITVKSSNTSSVVATETGFKAVKPGYARVTIKSIDGTVDSQVKVYVGGGCTKGDINADGQINSLDALIALKSAVGSVNLNAEEKDAADVNSDNAVNSLDALIILQISTKIKSIWDFV